MDYNKFEDRISDWIENSMDIKERKEFEKYLAENPEHKKKVDDVRNAMNIMKTAPSLKTSDSFDKKLEDLTLSESATIAALVQLPSRVNPVKDPRRTIQRRDWILSRMLKLNYINLDQYEEAKNQDLKLAKNIKRNIKNFFLG